MAEVVDDEKLLIHFFQDSLSDVSLTWYMRLDNTKVKKWKDLVDAFMRQYKFNIDMGPDRLNLQAMEKDNKESIREYARRWREVAAQVNPPMLEKEMISLFSNSFKAPYFEYLVRSSAQHFTDLVVIAERIEQAIGLGKIANLTEKNGFTEGGCQGTYRSYS
jgi:YesN/AraC family two-component response regulator